ncbi:NtaA/DmoA family FMN-dependent monooxygenase [Streptomyces sp. GQFP]|uniref:NtaA/DmoA family FMN-dependent monooxygenase n=1 Tax=Streptomyces sp. GQFP TaxID=2907545 RepID=UPI001EEC6F66|nr:NtaA/DmoA family FMN-dependent monooxygenase [Streptomyces sp. GQFP]UIX29317.1 NtaA/DmoA family FMN-dependent monooxygenase [Streptomyces sp. GQFP]
MRKDTMLLAAFTQASVTQTGVGAWMHSGSDPHVLDADYYINLGREVERGGFDLIFFDDRLAAPAAYGGSVREAVRRGSRVIKLDLLTILTLVAANTSRIGLGATYSTTYYNPYHVARAFATLDHVSKGRAVWNIVTSLNAEEAANFGVGEVLEHDQRYDRADEFLEIVTGLWESWEKDAIQLDRETGIFADPDKVHQLDYRGKYLSSQGPLTVPRPPQGWPVLLQAGQSGRGRQFAGRWADLIFAASTELEGAKKSYAAQHDVAAEAGRTAPPARILPCAQVVVGPTEQVAREKKAYLESLGDPVEGLIQLAELADVDLSAFPKDEPFPDDLLDRVTGSKAVMQNLLAGTEKAYGRKPTPADLGNFFAGRTGGHQFVGDPGQVADEMAEWFHGYACDGFAIAQNDSPGSFQDFGRYVVPELRKRGLVPEVDATPRTVRDRLGLGSRVSRGADQA